MQRHSALAIACAALAAFSLPLIAQTAPPSSPDAATWSVPRTPWGDPDLQGVWPGTAMMGVPMERPLPPTGPRGGAGRGGGGAGLGPPGHWGEQGQPQRQTSLVVEPPDGRIPPMTDEGR